MAIVCLYFLFVSKNWFTLNFYVLMLGYASFLVALICPESPRWLLISGKRAKAIEVLNYMAKINGKSPDSIPKDA